MNDNENRKATVPGMDLIAEIFRNTTRIEAGMGEMKRQNADDKMVIMQRFNTLESRVDTIETYRKRDSEIVNEALRSSSDLSKHVSSTETAMKSAVDNLSAGMGKRMSEAESQLASLATETKAQTPMLQKLETMLAEQNAYERIKEQTKREAAERETETAARHKRRLKWAYVGIGVLGIVVPAITAYLGTSQANKDAPPKTVVVHEGSK